MVIYKRSKWGIFWNNAFHKIKGVNVHKSSTQESTQERYVTENIPL